MKFYHVTEVVNIELMPPDAVLATLYFHIKSSSYSSNFVSKEIAKVMYKVVVEYK